MPGEQPSLVSATLAGRAVRIELAHLIASLEGPLTDSTGKPLLTPEGAPLKLGRALWLSPAGSFHLTTNGRGPGLLGTHSSSLLLYGFDAIYPVVGFDGRALAPPRFVAVQAQVNGSEFEWVFGQPPLSAGWTRAVIERLKDSASSDHNLLGEMLEEALIDRRFDTLVIRGEARGGGAVVVPRSFTHLSPGADSFAYA